MPVDLAEHGRALGPGDVFELRVPASIANLGPGFDALAVAVELYLTLTVTVMPGTGALDFHFHNGAPLGRNLIAHAFEYLASQHQDPLPSLLVEVQSDIPMRAGLGSSAAATIAGLRLFTAAAHRSLDDDELLTAATALEGHPDNVAAALLGGLALSRQRVGAVSAVTLPWPRHVCFLALTPEFQLSTSAAREVIPGHFARADAVSNLQHLALLLWAVSTGSTQHLREAMYDRLHQPYRQKLVPGLAKLLVLDHPSLLGLCLSGAGPSLIALAEEQNILAVREAVESCYQRTGLTYTVRELRAHASKTSPDAT